MFDRVLPIGSIVLLKGGKRRVMVIGYCKYKDDDRVTIYDYAGCLYPQGFMSPEKTVLFNHEQIERIYSLGFQNEERFAFEERLKCAIAEVKK